MPKSLQKDLYEYFDYYWDKDRNYAIKDNKDAGFYKTLPRHIKLAVRFVIMRFNLIIDIALQRFLVQRFSIQLLALL